MSSFFQTIYLVRHFKHRITVELAIARVFWFTTCVLVYRSLIRAVNFLDIFNFKNNRRFHEPKQILGGDISTYQCIITKSATPAAIDGLEAMAKPRKSRCQFSHNYGAVRWSITFIVISARSEDFFFLQPITRSLP